MTFAVVGCFFFSPSGVDHQRPQREGMLVFGTRSRQGIIQLHQRCHMQVRETFGRRATCFTYTPSLLSRARGS